ncbi:siphovirus Gp157 family protein [Devosia sp. 2618]|uniref:siphovirus Gp157 family protein n=1 Tax=Devosia sp. 2618 TaxID=3156454 RepID=UPI003397807D
MADYLTLDAAKLESEIRHMLVVFPELADDEELRLDTLEGETDFNRIMSRLVRVRNEKLADAEGLGSYIGDLSERKARQVRGADGVKALMLSLMSVADLPKLVLPEATISVTKPRSSVEVIDVDALPQGTFSIVRQPDKAAIKAQLEAGDDVPGATLKTSEPGLTVRTK